MAGVRYFYFKTDPFLLHSSLVFILDDLAKPTLVPASMQYYTLSLQIYVKKKRKLRRALKLISLNPPYLIMKYQSSRGGVKDLSFEDVLFAGYAPDGGLFVPSSIPRLSLETLR